MDEILQCSICCMCVFGGSSENRPGVARALGGGETPSRAQISGCRRIMHNALDEDEEGKSSDHSQACINQLPLIYSEWYALLSSFFSRQSPPPFAGVRAVASVLFVVLLIVQ